MISTLTKFATRHLGAIPSHLMTVAFRVLVYRALTLVGLFNLAILLRRSHDDRVFVIFQAYALHIAQFHRPLIEALSRKHGQYRVALQVLHHPHFPREEARRVRRFAREVLRMPRENILSFWWSQWVRPDLLVCADVYARFPMRKTRKCLILHGAGLTSRVFSRSLFRKSLADFDRVLVNGPYDLELARARLKIDKTDSRVVDAGFPFLDALAKPANGDGTYHRRLSLKRQKRTILIAPSWRGLTLRADQGAAYIEETIASVKDLDVNIVLKPHACSLNPVMAKGVEWRTRLESLACTGAARYDLDTNDLPALRHCDILITDISSRAFVFMLLGKPVIHYFPSVVSFDRLDEERLQLIRSGSLIATTPDEIRALVQNLLMQYGGNPLGQQIARRCYSHFGCSTAAVIQLFETWLEIPRKSEVGSSSHSLMRRVTRYPATGTPALRREHAPGTLDL